MAASSSSADEARVRAHSATCAAISRTSAAGTPSSGSKTGLSNHSPTWRSTASGSSAAAATFRHALFHTAPPTPGARSSAPSRAVRRGRESGETGRLSSSNIRCGSLGAHSSENISGITCNAGRHDENDAAPRVGTPYRASASSSTTGAAPRTTTCCNGHAPSSSCRSHAANPSPASHGDRSVTRSRLPSPRTRPASSVVPSTSAACSNPRSVPGSASAAREAGSKTLVSAPSSAPTTRRQALGRSDRGSTRCNSSIPEPRPPASSFSTRRTRSAKPAGSATSLSASSLARASSRGPPSAITEPSQPTITSSSRQRSSLRATPQGSTSHDCE